MAASEEHSARYWSGSPFPQQSWKSSTVAGDGCDIHLVRGPATPGRPALLLLPGLCDPWHSFEPVLEELSGVFNVLCLDWRGHGPSARPRSGQYGVANHLGDALAVLERIGPCVVAGNSLGALVAAGLGARRPDLVQAVILEDGPFFITERARWTDHPLRTRAFGELSARLRRREEEQLDDKAFTAVYATRPFAFHPSGPGANLARWAEKFAAVTSPLWQEPQDDGARESRRNALSRMASGGTASWGELFPRSFVEKAAQKYAGIDWQAAAAAASPGFSDAFDHGEALRAIRSPILFLEADRDLSGLLNDFDRAMLLKLGGTRMTHILVDGALHEMHASHRHLVAAAIISRFG